MRHFPLFVLIIFVGLGTNAQTLGIKINPEADMLQGAPKPHFGIACGVFYNQKIYKPLGFSTGIEYEQIRYYNPPGFFYDDFGSNYRITKVQLEHLMEMPFDLTLRMNENPYAKCLAFFTIGYAFGEMFENSFVYDESRNIYTINVFNLPSKSSIINSFRMGMEVRYNPIPKLNLAFGIQYKYVSPDEYSLRYGLNKFNVLGAYIKTGLNFSHKKVALKKS